MTVHGGGVFVRGVWVARGARYIPAVFLLCACFASVSCASGAITPEEYYNLGMAYFDLGKYDEAAKWLERARSTDRTQSASEYTLGRIAFARGDYPLALRYFDRILHKDPKNVTALRAAAYTLIRLERFEDAEEYYGRLLELVPESADSGYSYAIVLMAIKQPARAEEVLSGYAEMLAGNREAELLLARARREQGKVEAIEDYRRYLAAGDDPRVRLEYAGMLEAGEFYARALEEYRRLLQEASTGSAGAGMSAPELRFAVGRLLLIADNAEEGIAEIEGAVADGFTGDDAMEALLQSGRVPQAQRETLRRIIQGVASAKQP